MYTSTLKIKPAKWNTIAGTFYTRKKTLIKFKLSEFSIHKEISWTVHVNSFIKPEEAQYNVIIGTNLMKKLGIDISFSNQVIYWNDVTVLMKQKGILSNQEIANNVYQILIDIFILKMSEDRHNEIIKLIYKKVYMHKCVMSLNYISKNQ